MDRLFAVQNEKGQKLAKDPDSGRELFFTAKSDAKALRDSLNGGAFGEVDRPQWVVVKGPDHRLAG